ncbi:aldehyde dehydrogenase family protein [Pedobacter sp. MW01-1-1]|uniref:aldehyde dehydrogenase family protein n=1 Tax=Pedobacter sp. MW01-1-1 TaxID=3383027 RepID=UPI003FF0255D
MKEIFEAQQKHAIELRKSTAAERIASLKKLKEAIQLHEEEIFAALEKDLRKSRFEAGLTEVFFTYSEIDFAIKNLKKWMKPLAKARNLMNIFASSKVYYEPKGTCLIIAPWNYPFQLMMSPLVSAIAAGNTAMLKPSELSEATSVVLAKLIEKTFRLEEVACFLGEASISTQLLALPFNHIFFTGSPAIGKIVMAAAAKNLSSVTLELGGKSPAVIDASADIEKTAQKIIWGKFLNAGQTCIAPDYVLIDEKIESKFVAHSKDIIQQFFYEEGLLNKDEYGKIINRKQFDRIRNLLDEALLAGATLVVGGKYEELDLTIEPTILKGVDAENPIMKEEIFGPILPIIRYKELSAAIELINSKEKPLALYIMSNDSNIQQKIIQETSAGGTCVNDTLVHISNSNLPFGGVNNSGTGSCHGFYGFKSFSHERAVLFQSKLGLSKLAYPPYEKKKSLMNFFKKWM